MPLRPKVFVPRGNAATHVAASVGPAGSSQVWAANPAHIADGFVLKAEHPGAYEIAQPQQPRDLDRVPPVALDLFTGPFGDQRRRNDPTVEALGRQLALARQCPLRAGAHFNRAQPAQGPPGRLASRVAPRAGGYLIWVHPARNRPRLGLPGSREYLAPRSPRASYLCLTPSVQHALSSW